MAFSTGIRGLLAPILAGLTAQFPDLQLDITEQDPPQAVQSVAAGAADFALVHDADGLPATVPSSLVGRRIHTDVGDVVLHRGHALATAAGPLTTADLLSHSWVTSPPGTVCHQWFRRLFTTGPEQPEVRHQVDDFATQLSLVSSGQVLALIPRLARPHLGPDLVVRPLARPPTREVQAVWRRSADSSPAIRALLAALGS